MYQNGKTHNIESFIVVEDFHIPWMVPFLTPHGLIMKLNAHPVSITSQMFAKNKTFWDQYTADLLSDKSFLGNKVARANYSKLRSSQARNFANRGQVLAAEYAYKQALQLDSSSSEASFGLMNLMVQQKRYGEARKIVTALGKFNSRFTQPQIQATLEKIERAEQQTSK